MKIWQKKNCSVFFINIYLEQLPYIPSIVCSAIFQSFLLIPHPISSWKAELYEIEFNRLLFMCNKPFYDVFFSTISGMKSFSKKKLSVWWLLWLPWTCHENGYILPCYINLRKGTKYLFYIFPLISGFKIFFFTYINNLSQIQLLSYIII